MSPRPEPMPEIVFKGKEFVYNHHLSVPYRPLVVHPDKGIGAPDLGGNLIIHGDNLAAQIGRASCRERVWR